MKAGVTSTTSTVPRIPTTALWVRTSMGSPGFIRERLLVTLPKYMLPTVFNHMPLMPRNPNGKIDRQKLVSSLN